MEKIIKQALASKFDAQTIETLMEVIYATPNGNVAVELLLGFYEEPVINPEPCSKVFPPDRYSEMQIVRYDKWEDKVHYTCKVKTENSLGEVHYRDEKSSVQRKRWNDGMW